MGRAALAAIVENILQRDVAVCTSMRNRIVLALQRSGGRMSPTENLCRTTIPPDFFSAVNKIGTVSARVTMTDPSTVAIDSGVFVQSILGQMVVCTLSDGRTASGRLVCVDRLYVATVSSLQKYLEPLVSHPVSLHTHFFLEKIWSLPIAYASNKYAPWIIHRLQYCQW